MLGAPLNQYIYPILHTVQDALYSIYIWTRTVLFSIFQNDGALHSLQPLFLVSVAIAALLISIVIIRKLVWRS